MKTFRSAVSGLRNFWIDHLWFDLAIVVLAVGLHVLLVMTYSSFDILGNALPSDRRTVYGSTAVVVSLLGSFSAVAIGQLGSARGPRADTLRSHAAEVLARNWRSIFRAGMLSALLSIVALLVDPSVVTDSAVAVVARWLFEAGLIFAAVKFVRLSSLFYEVITLASKSASDDEERLVDAPVANPEWHKNIAS